MKIEEGECYHIFNRGNNKNIIFFEDDNYTYFLNRFVFYVKPYVEVYAYCLMPNHFHIFLRVLDKPNFEKGIKIFFISYVKSINERYGRVGSLFQGRYKCKKVDSQSYYTRIITYIHQNPKAAGMVVSLADYKYSSYMAYISDKETLINKNEVVDWFGGLEAFVLCHE